MENPVTMPAATVIVPCHNGGRFLEGLLASLTAQVFGDFEVIVVNDGSTEEATICQLARLPSSIRVVHQENRYLPGARNAGFRHARAELVLPLDCDDRLAPCFLAETIEIMRQASPEVGFVFTHLQLTGALEGVVPRHFNAFDQLFLNQLPYAMLIRRSAWERVGGYDESMRDGFEDWEFAIRLARAGYRGIELGKPLLTYRVCPNGLLMRRSARMYASLWRHIRGNHRELYRPKALFALWRSTRKSRHRVSLPVACGLLLFARLVPDAWFNVVFYRAMLADRARQVARGALRPGVPDSGRSSPGVRPVHGNANTR
jgi:glycosyltransferase involved in cell wall biosynthesis